MKKLPPAAWSELNGPPHQRQHKDKVKLFCAWLRWMSETSELIPLQSRRCTSLALVCIKQNARGFTAHLYYGGSSTFIAADFRLQWDYLFIAAPAEHLLKVQWNKSLVPPAEAVSGRRCSQCLSTVIPKGFIFLHPPLPAFYYTTLWENKEPLSTLWSIIPPQTTRVGAPQFAVSLLLGLLHLRRRDVYGVKTGRCEKSGWRLSDALLLPQGARTTHAFQLLMAWI